MCGQSRPRAADPAVNPAQSSGPAVLSPLGATPGALNASRVGAPAPEDAPEAASAQDRAVRVPCPSRSPPLEPTWGACRKPRARLPADPGGTWLRCPPPAGPPVGLSCWSVLPASWSRLSPAALSAHSYLERPGPAGAAAAMAPPRGREGLCATQPQPPSCAPGPEAPRCGAGLRGGGPIGRFSLPDVPTWRPQPRTCEPRKPRSFELNAPLYLFLNSHIAPIQLSPARKEGTVDGGREVLEILRKKKTDTILGDPP